MRQTPFGLWNAVYLQLSGASALTSDMFVNMTATLTWGAGLYCSLHSSMELPSKHLSKAMLVITICVKLVQYCQKLYDCI